TERWMASNGRLINAVSPHVPLLISLTRPLCGFVGDRVAPYVGDCFGRNPFVIDVHEEGDSALRIRPLYGLVGWLVSGDGAFVLKTCRNIECDAGELVVPTLKRRLDRSSALRGDETGRQEPRDRQASNRPQGE